MLDNAGKEWPIKLATNMLLRLKKVYQVVQVRNQQARLY